MNDSLKKKQLKNYKTLATGLFIIMALVFVWMTILQKDDPQVWVGYVKAFSEAAMVGALADWFAVTALFHHPLGLPIPHTNLIEKSKKKIGDNLGSFVVENFLSPQNIRPYILKLKVSVFLSEWLSKERNQNILINELSNVLSDVILKLEDVLVVKFISNKADEMLINLKINKIIGNGLEYLIDHNDHQKLITNLSGEIKTYVLTNRQMIAERVEKESFFFIPKSVDQKIADKITQGLSDYFAEVEENINHPLRAEITTKLMQFADELKTSERWEQEFDVIKKDYLQPDKLQRYASDIWQSIKNSFLSELQREDSQLKQYIKKNLNELVYNLQSDESFQNKIDHWTRMTAYKYILKNTQNFGNLISTTVGNWEGKELSQKLELEVGKDLQFIRINGTLVGGLVGLLIYSIAQLI